MAPFTFPSLSSPRVALGGVALMARKPAFGRLAWPSTDRLLAPPAAASTAASLAALGIRPLPPAPPLFLPALLGLFDDFTALTLPKT